MRKTKFNKRNIQVNESFEGETIETKMCKIFQGTDSFDNISPEIYTLRKDGVRPEYNIRTDKWDVALEGTAQATNKWREQRKERLAAAEKIAKEGKPEAEA